MRAGERIVTRPVLQKLRLSRNYQDNCAFFQFSTGLHFSTLTTATTSTASTTTTGSTTTGTTYIPNQPAAPAQSAETADQTNAEVEAANFAQNVDSDGDGIADSQFSGLSCWSCHGHNLAQCAQNGRIEKCSQTQVSS